MDEITNQLKTLTSLYLINRINTGEKALDASLNVFAGLLISILLAHLSGVIRILYAKFIIVFAKCKSHIWKIKYDPLKFDVNEAPTIIDNNKDPIYQQYSATIKTSINSLAYWFLTHFRTAKFKESSHCFHVFNTSTGVIKLDLTEEDIKKFIMYDYEAILKTFFKTPFPVYKHTNGSFVYLSSNHKYAIEDKCILLVSNDYEALLECTTIINTFSTKLTEISKKVYINNTDQTQYLFRITNDSNIPVVIAKLPPCKTFDTLFFDGKEELIEMLTKFKNKTLVPSHIPVDNKIGIILYGPAGTGKSSILTAIANFMKKGIIMVSTLDLDCKNKLKTALGEGFITVFEEIDTMEGIKKRDNKQSNLEIAKANYIKVDASDTEEVMRQKLKLLKDERKDKVDFGYFLQKIDGMEQMDDKILIATTNYIDHLDDAILRPGRFGYKLHIDKFSSENLRKTLEYMYQTKINEALPHRQWTLAEVMQIYMINPNVQDAIQIIKDRDDSSVKTDLTLPSGSGSNPNDAHSDFTC